MKSRSTTPVFYQISAHLLFYLLAALAIMLLAALPQAAGAQPSIDEKISHLSDQIDKNDSLALTLNTKVKTLGSQLRQLDNEQSTISSQITSTKAKQSLLKKETSVLKQKMLGQRDALGAVMADAYVDGSMSPLEMLASSHSIADFVDQQAYRSSIQDKLTSMISDLKKSQSELAKQQTAIARAAVDQKFQQAALLGKKQDQQKLLASTNGQETAYIRLSKAQAAEKKRLQEQQQVTMTSALSGATQVESVPVQQPVALPAPTPPPVDSPVSNSPSPSAPSKPKSVPTPPIIGNTVMNGGYPANLNNCYVDSNAMSYGLDPWGYGCRQCVSYVAYKMLEKTGSAPMYWGNANQWPGSARAHGYKTSTKPRAGSIGVLLSGPYGHVVWVESVNKNGTINVSQYNYWLPNKPNGGWGYYSAFKNVSPSAYQVYIYV